MRTDLSLSIHTIQMIDLIDQNRLFFVIGHLYNRYADENVRGTNGVEQILVAHRDRALELLRENRAESREGIELLVRERLPKVAEALRNGAPLTTPQLEALYTEMLDLSFVMFSLGYTIAHTVEEQPNAHK